MAAIAFLLPGNMYHSIDRDLDISNDFYSYKKEAFEPYFNFIKNLDIRFINISKCPKNEMDDFLNEIHQDWHDLVYVLYPEPSANCYDHHLPGRAWFFGRKNGYFVKNDPNGEEVGLSYVLDSFDNRGIFCIPINMDVKDDSPTISIWPVSVSFLEQITSLPKVIFQHGRLVLPNTDIWLKDINTEVFSYLKLNPDYLRKVSPRDFEKFVSSIFNSHGYQVSLTPESRDGGMDIIAIENAAGEKKKTILIECKRYNQNNKVGIGIVQRMLGVVSDYRATQGIVVTTSSFTGAAKNVEARNKKSLSLKDYTDLVAWLGEIKI